MHFRWVNVLLFIMIKSLTIMYWSCAVPQWPGKSSLKLNNIVIMFNYGSYWQHFSAFTWKTLESTFFLCYYFVPDGHCMPLLHCTFPLLFLLAYFARFFAFNCRVFVFFANFVSSVDGVSLREFCRENDVAAGLPKHASSKHVLWDSPAHYYFP